MKILVQVGNLGSSIILHRMGPIAHAQSVDKILVVCRNPGPEIPKLEYHCPPRFISSFAPIAVGYEFFTLLYLSIFRKPDCVSGYHLFPHGLMAFIVAKLTRRPVIASLIAGPKELYGLGNLLGVEFTKPLPRMGRLLLNMLNHCAAVTTTGSFTSDFLIRQGLERAKIHAIINPPNDSRVYATAAPKIYDVIWVGMLDPVKHAEVLLYAVSKVTKRLGEIRVCVVGDGPCKDQLIELADELRLNNNVDFVGFQEDVAYYYNSSKIFVFTSEREGFPNVFLEAMACGIPCVVSNCGDITDVAQDGLNCVLIQRYNDCEGFAEGIIRLMQDKDLYCKLSQNALKTVKELSLENVVQEWGEILKNIGGEANPRD